MKIENKSTRLTIDNGDAFCSIQDFYSKISELLGYDPEAVSYDARKISCTADIQYEIFAWYRDHGKNAVTFSSEWNKYGPKYCICDGVRTVVVEDGFIYDGSNVKEQLIADMAQKFGLCGNMEYISTHFGESLDVYKNNGTMRELEAIVQMEEVLGFHVSYELFKFIDHSFRYQDDDMHTPDQSDYDDLMLMCSQFAA